MIGAPSDSATLFDNWALTLTSNGRNNLPV